jgi:hypothetical protein
MSVILIGYGAIAGKKNLKVPDITDLTELLRLSNQREHGSRQNDF